MKDFNPISKRHHLSKLVAQEIEKAIITKKYLPAERLPSEQEFCDQFDVSRTAVREALQTLSARGLIRIEKGRGVFVERFSSKTVTDPFYLFLELNTNPSYVYDVIKIRQLLEPQVAGLAAIHHKPVDIVGLNNNLERLKRKSIKIEEIAKLDMEFHLLMAKASGNELMSLVLEPVHRLMPRIKLAVIQSVNDAKESAIEWHSRILQHVIDRDEKGSVKAMKDHLLHAEEHMREMLKTTSDSSNGIKN